MEEEADSPSSSDQSENKVGSKESGLDIVDKVNERELEEEMRDWNISSLANKGDVEESMVDKREQVMDQMMEEQWRGR